MPGVGGHPMPVDADEVSQQSLGERALESADSRHSADRGSARDGLHGQSGTVNAHSAYVSSVSH